MERRSTTRACSTTNSSRRLPIWSRSSTIEPWPSSTTSPAIPPEEPSTSSSGDDLLAFAAKHDLWIISDEVYDRIVFETEHVVSFMGTGYDKLMVVNSFSKTFAMTGWRIGYIVSTNLEAMKQVVKIQYYISACSNDAMQYAVLEAMEKANDYPSMMATGLQKRCKLIVDRLNAMPGVQCHQPKGSIYVFPKVDVHRRRKTWRWSC